MGDTEAHVDPNDIVLHASLARVFGIDSQGQGKALIQMGQFKSTGQVVCIKRFFIDESTEEAIKLIRHEVVTMRQIRHEHILPCLSSFALPSNMEVWLLSPLMEMGSMRRILDMCFPDGIPEAAASPVIRDVLLGLIHLHERGIVHRAIKAAHILIDKSGRAKLSGLRYSCTLYEYNTELPCVASTGHSYQDRYDYPLFVANKHLNWMSPEVLQQNLLGYNEKSDIYSLGVTVCEMANGIIPYSDMPSTFMLLEKMRGAAPKLLDRTTYVSPMEDKQQAAEENNHQELLAFSGQKPADSGVGASVASSSNLPKSAVQGKTFMSREFSENFHDFVDQCCYRDADGRLSASQLLTHPFIKQLKKSSSSGLSMASLVSSEDLITVDKPLNNDDIDESLTMVMDSKMTIDDDTEWDFE